MMHLSYYDVLKAHAGHAAKVKWILDTQGEYLMEETSTSLHGGYVFR